MKNSRHLGKKAEWWWREIKSYVTPKNWKAYRELKDSTLLTGSSESKRRLALFDFHSIAIDNVGGRYLYHIVHDFVAAGYTPCYKTNYRFVSNIKSKGFKKHLLSFDHIFYNSEENLIKYGTIEAILSDRKPTLKTSQSPRKTFVDYALRRAKKNEAALTFGPSPVLLRDNLFSPSVVTGKERLNRVFFAGRMRAREYDRDLLRKNYGM